jgi:hypothetical protein
MNIYTPNTDTPDYKNQIPLNVKTQINTNTIIVCDFNNP